MINPLLANKNSEEKTSSNIKRIVFISVFYSVLAKKLNDQKAKKQHLQLLSHSR